jgi:hypothetical protein
MGKGPSSFKQTDAARLYKAAVAGGMRDPQIEMDLQRKKIVVRSGPPEQGVADAGEWDIPDDAA